MKKDLTLVIMAAGMGSRFGGLKQIEPVGPNGEFIIDYSIYDALKAGFNKVVFIIKEENYDIFKETVGSRVEPHIHVEYVFQKQEDVPSFVREKTTRVKPWGTAHAILSAKDKVQEPFLIINADDFYGRDSYLKAAEFLQDTREDSSLFCGIMYQVKNTLTENGSVKRGVCVVENDHLVRLTESKLETEEGKVIATPLNGSEPFEVSPISPVSMNMFGFKPSIFQYLEKDIVDFFNQNIEELETCEYLIPEVVFEMIEKNLIEVKGITTTSIWLGVTYREDKEKVVSAIQTLVEDKEYPIHLWD